jgi:hypothetical protein
MSDHDDDVLRFPAEDADDAALGARLATMYRALPPRPQADADRCVAAVLSEAARQPSGWRRALPRQRWWWGAAAAAMLVAVTMRPWRPGVSARDADSAFTDAAARSAVPPKGSITPVPGGEAVRFDITLPAGAKDVALVGDFNGWDENATPMLRRNGDGTWTAQVALSPGRHVYAFVVDGGRWLVDPLAPQVPDAGFGPANAVVVDGSR